MYRLTVWAVVLLPALLSSGCKETPQTSREPDVGAVLYVATNGNDAWSGRLAAPESAKKDGPFATLDRARDEARKWRAASAAQVRIVVCGGTHHLPKALALEPQDSGLIIEGGPNKDAVLSGGRAVTGWKPYTGAILQADLSGLDLPDLAFRELYYNGARQPMARVPNFDPNRPRHGGFLQNAAVVEKDVKTKFCYREGELRPEKWSHIERAWLEFHDALNYETQIARLKGVDAANRILEVERGVYRLSVGNPYYVFGIMEELDAPGEWYADPDKKVLYFWPPSGDPNKDAVIVPALDSAFVLQGDPKAGRYVENVRLVGLAIRDCRGRAVQMTGAKGCLVAACDMRNVGVGVYLGDDTHACRVAGCDITQTLGDGVSIIGSSTDHARVTDHVVDNNYIWDIGWGRIHNRCGGVYMHRMMRCKVTRNHIHDTPRYAIGMDVGSDCEIAWNYGHHANLVTCDTSIIEAATALDWNLPQEEELERNRRCNWNNTIHHNLLHDSGGWGTTADGSLAFPHYSWGIYLDTHSSGWRVHDNVVYNTILGGYMVNGGLDNVCENNVFVDGKVSQAFLNEWPKYPMGGNRFERNILAYRGLSAYLYQVPRLKDEDCRFADNLVWADGQPITIKGLRGVSAKKSWAAWLERGQDKGTLVADPEFVNPAARDYRLKETSPAFKLGFKAIDLSTVGNYESPERRTWPRPEVPVRREPADYAPPAESPDEQPALRDYESSSPGETERRAHVGAEGGSVCVTGETAASGRHSLKFTDAAGQKHTYTPYVTYPLEVAEGVMRAGFDLRIEAGALFVYEWRDDPYKYNLGPRLSTDAEGWLSANGQRLVQLPHGKWVRFDLACGLGPQAAGVYDLTIKAPAAEPQVFRALACSPQFKTLNCIVVMSLADAPTVFYLDNVELRPGERK